MMLAALFLLLLTVEGASSEDNCSYQYLLKHLNLSLSNKKDLYTMSRPVKNHETTTDVSLQMIISAILDMRESDHTFISNVWIYMEWMNEHIGWDPDDFCGIYRILVPAAILWKPDLTIEEMSESYKAFQSPYLMIFRDGHVSSWNPQVLVSACKMQVHKFPFDMQTCNISFRSITHTDEELNLKAIFNSTEATEWSREVMKTQYEWLYVNMSTTHTTVNYFDFKQSMIVYTVTMKRRSVLYIVNFLLPILFFLCLDFCSFLISDNGGEKLSFKITVLLAVTVMQIILNEILPSSSNIAPLIAVYCLGVFGLMLLSLLETIVVMYLMEKDSESRDNEADRDRSLNEDSGNKHGKAKFICNGEKKKWTLACISDASAEETPSELLKGSSSQLTEETHGAEKLSDDLREVMKTLALLHDSKKEEVKPGYWTKKTKTINKVFFIFYFIASCVFLVFLFSGWYTT